MIDYFLGYTFQYLQVFVIFTKETVNVNHLNEMVTVEIATVSVYQRLIHSIIQHLFMPILRYCEGIVPCNFFPPLP